MKEGQYCKVDGSVEISELERSAGITAELILIAVSPAFDMNHNSIQFNKFISSSFKADSW